jgi:hypothetical protein
MALLHAGAMVDALLREVERMVNGPVPLADRPKRISELAALLETLQRQALAMGAELSEDFHPQVVLGVRVMEGKRASRVA